MTNIEAPAITDRSGPSWTGVSEGMLCIQRCGSCGVWLLPARVRCPRCFRVELASEPVSGWGSVLSFTLNRLAEGDPDVSPPIVAEVELVEQPGLRLLTKLVRVATGEIYVGLEVHVEFEQVDDAWVPVFAP